MAPRIIVALAVLCVLAGCNGLTGSDTTPTTGQEPKVSPAPVPQSEFPPGVNDRTVTNVSELVVAHDNRLRGDSVTIRIQRTDMRPDGTVLTNRTTHFALGADHVSRNTKTVVTRGDQRRIQTQTWANESTMFTRIGVSSGSQIRESTPQKVQPSSQLKPSLSLVGDDLSAESVTITRSEDGPTVFRIVANNIKPYDASHSNASLTMLVGEGGVIHEYQYVANRSCSGQDCRIVNRIGFTDIGETEIRTPEWIRNASSEVTKSESE